jgi:hypothetical protein
MIVVAAVQTDIAAAAVQTTAELAVLMDIAVAAVRTTAEAAVGRIAGAGIRRIAETVGRTTATAIG